LLLVVGIAMFFAVRYYGFRAGWWTSIIPGRDPINAGIVRGVGMWFGNAGRIGIWLRR